MSEWNVGDRCTTEDDPDHAATILTIDRYGMATIQFDQRFATPFPPDEVDVGDLRPLTTSTRPE